MQPGFGYMPTSESSLPVEATTHHLFLQKCSLLLLHIDICPSRRHQRFQSSEHGSNSSSSLGSPFCSRREIKFLAPAGIPVLYPRRDKTFVRYNY
jgi:hypothetical protein